jgi:cyclopropane fatty-acyl-phospholipid synthase-like methyltransferase
MYNLNQAYDKKYFEGHQFYRKTYMEIARYIYEMFEPRSVLDVGCGAGFMLESFVYLLGSEGQGFPDVLGIDGAEASKEISPVRAYMETHDFRIPFYLGRTFDLVLSIEVAEHIEEEYADRFCDLLVNHANSRIVMTAAPVGQGGTNHVNCQPREYWVKKMEERGFKFDLFRTSQIKNAVKTLIELNKCNIGYLPNNFMVFGRINNG